MSWLVTFELLRLLLLIISTRFWAIFRQKLSNDFHQLKIRFLYVGTSFIFLQTYLSEKFLLTFYIKIHWSLNYFLLKGRAKSHSRYAFDFLDQILECLQWIYDNQIKRVYALRQLKYVTFFFLCEEKQLLALFRQPFNNSCIDASYSTLL